MIWSYVIVLSLGILLGWTLARFRDRLFPTPSTTPDRAAPNPTALSPIPATPDSLPPQPTTSQPTIPPLPPNHAHLTVALAHHLGQYQAGFLARTSHELRSPLNRVMSLQQLILADLCDNPEEERDFTRKSYEAAEELLALLDQTTTISKLAHGTFPLQLEPLSLIERLSELLMQTQLHAKNRNLRLTIDLPETEVEVVADLACLRQVLLNLVTTPIYLMDEGSINVTHQVNTAEQTVSIYVEDQRPATAWSESTELADAIHEKVDPINTPPTAAMKAEISEGTESGLPSSSWGLSMITTTELVAAMQGKLTILASSAASDPHTRVECILPLGSDRPSPVL
ncbi:MAG: histidine kinase dimerization/phospho-acceptor domain-containing protein [Leptolyngbyaceae cyanobacterium]